MICYISIIFDVYCKIYLFVKLYFQNNHFCNRNRVNVYIFQESVNNLWCLVYLFWIDFNAELDNLHFSICCFIFTINCSTSVAVRFLWWTKIYKVPLRKWPKMYRCFSRHATNSCLKSTRFLEYPISLSSHTVPLQLLQFLLYSSYWHTHSVDKLW